MGHSPGDEITPEALYLRRREFMRNVALAGLTASAVGGSLIALTGGGRGRSVEPSETGGARLEVPRESAAEALTSYRDVTTYNNFYEFGSAKHHPSERAGSLRIRPWTVRIDGEVRRPETLDFDALVRRFAIEERVYRLRCVEAWSMVIPWSGFPLGALIRQVEPTSRAKYVAFTTLHDPEQMPGQRSPILAWPYVEALRIDEAVHPLTLLAVGLYGKPLPNQNGAPIRLVVPWKYGFKSGKSIVRITFTKQQPKTTWNQAAPEEYGFYANVNPAVDHPRWSQSTERRIGELSRRPTLPFNGYADQVAHLYAGMDLRRYY